MIVARVVGHEARFTGHRVSHEEPTSFVYSSRRTVRVANMFLLQLARRLGNLEQQVTYHIHSTQATPL
jgi:hypothetical protein